jgi:hypothetical protein
MRAKPKTTCAVAFGAVGLVALTATPASADEPVAASEPRLLNETAEVTSVVDAFDEGDPFDLHLTVGFMQTWKSANIRRETSLNQPGLTTGNFTNRTENIAAFSQSVSTLDLGADIGIYKDLALIIRLPIILSDSQQLTGLDGSDSPQVQQQRLADPSGQGQLFSLPFKSPTRSGVDWFSVGLDWAIFNQMRDSTKPTWVIGFEGRFGVGTPLHACSDTPITISNPANPTDNKRSCPDPTDPTKPDRDPGISRAMTSVGAHTIFSRRFGYVEPYSGLWFLAEFPQDRGDFGATNNFQGALVNHPPLIGTFAMGMEVIPWERREEFQRLVGDFRVSGTYHSPGREYSELFDALGTSQAPSLRSPNPASYTAGPNGTSIADPQAQKVYFTGITDQQAYGSIGAQASATWQAGEYVKFTTGLGYQFNQSHAITSADSCNPDFTNDSTKAGPCLHNPNTPQQAVTGIPNPNHRDSIDLPGRRFSADDTSIWNLWIMGVVMF